MGRVIGNVTGPTRHSAGSARLVGASIVVAVLASACGSSSPTTTPKAVVVTPGTIVPFTQAHNSRADVAVGSCTMVSGSWKMTGTVKNPTNATTSFQLVIDFVTHPGNTVLSTSVVSVPSVAPGSTTSWSATGASGKTDVACILRQAQTT